MADVQADDYTKLQKALKDPGLDKKVARAYSKRLREAAGPLGRLVLEHGVDEMPSGGGLQDYLMGRSPVAVSARSRGVDVWLGNKKKSQLSLMNRGFFRHPVFGTEDRTRTFEHSSTITRGKNKGKAKVTRNTVRQWAWVNQKVPAGAFDRALEHLAPEAQKRLAGTITDILKEIDLP